MTELKFSTMTMPGANLGKESSVPPLFPISREHWERVYELDEEDGQFTDFGWTENILPYRHQDLFDRALEPQTFKTAVLENDNLKAVFLPELGGRLWSLYDKNARRNLIYENDCFRPGNLALRNAWCSGGVEWNLGMVGHTPFTCEQIFTARLHDTDGTPVLRFYAFERVREVFYQMDFLLPEGSKVLLCRFRIKNPSDRTVPMYWWSNIAAYEDKSWRVIVPATEEYTNGPHNKETIPVRRDGVDISYPTNVETSRDGFFKIPPQKRKYIAYVSPGGEGFFQTSTSRLRGRKLFVWGQGPGADTWQNWLTDKAGRYIELQAGLGQSQYEHIPMPPRAAWEWAEAYGPIENADPQKIMGDNWDEANSEIQDRIEDCIGEKWLEDFLIRSKKDFALVPAEEVIFSGSGWGALEKIKREYKKQTPMESHLDFGKTGREQQFWLDLMKKGICRTPSPEEIPESYMISDEWKKYLIKAVSGTESENWYAHYLLGTIYMYEREYEEALNMYRKSVALRESPWGYYGMALAYYFLKEDPSAIYAMEQALELCRDDITLARDYCKMMNALGNYDNIRRIYNTLGEKVRKDPKIRYFYANASCRCGDIETAEEIIYANGGLQIPDMREGEESLTDLWFAIERAKAEKDGKEFDAAHAKPPAFLDFRMTVAKE